MKQRIITGTVCALVLIAVLLSPKIVLEIGVSLIAALSVYEVLKVTDIAKYKFLTVLSVLFAFVCTCFQYVPFLYILVILLFGYFMFNKNHITFEEISKAFFTAVFVPLLYGHLIAIRDMRAGQHLIWTVFVISLLTDTFAYFTGCFIGKHKLAPVLSPKKTVEGAIGGLFGGVIGMVALCGIFGYMGQTPNYFNAVIIAVICSAISQFGDLCASAIKRQYGVKDYGNIMPGHGGMMDRFDGVIFTAPAVCYLLLVLPII
ncbi:MAG: phosphatidate cytidylyltransferase [Clostridia bacterium]|nr:phosphatidate cytidylyltransferase [Clostridia bacterium]